MCPRSLDLFHIVIYYINWARLHGHTVYSLYVHCAAIHWLTISVFLQFAWKIIQNIFFLCICSYTRILLLIGWSEYNAHTYRVSGNFINWMYLLTSTNKSKGDIFFEAFINTWTGVTDWPSNTEHGAIGLLKASLKNTWYYMSKK